MTADAANPALGKARERSSTAASALAFHLLTLIVASHPLLWFLGLDQFAYPFLLMLPATLLISSRRSVYLSKVLLALISFLAVFLLSGLFIVESERYLTLLKNLSTYVTAALLLVVVPGTVTSWRRARQLLGALLFAVGVSGLVGLAAASGVWRPQFTSLASAFLPSSVAETALGRTIAERNLGWTSWFAGLGSYFRIKGLYLWPTSYAPVLVLTLPVAAYLAWRSRRTVSRLVLWALVLVLGVNLVFTTGRVAFAALGVAALYWLLIDKRGLSKLLRTLSVIVAVALMAGVALYEPVTIDLAEQLQEVVFARGTGSPESRMTIYRTTLTGFLERPIFGWGTERSIAGVSDSFIYPAGSHSYYLGVMYRHGIVGLACFALIWLAIWRVVSAPLRSRHEAPVLDDGPSGLLTVGRGVVVAALLMGLTLAFDLDAGLMFVWWLLVSVFVAVQRLPALGSEAREAVHL